MKRSTRNLLIAAAVLIAIPAGWYLLSPLFINVTVDESLPAENVFNNPKVVIEATKMMEESMASPNTEMDEPMPDEMVLEPKIISVGSFYDIAHEGNGTATIYELPDGSRVLRFEDFSVLNGPDLHVYLAPQSPVQDTVGVALEGAIDLGKLKGNIGDQNYEIPENIDLEGFASVVIWCDPFRVPFNAASLNIP